MNWTLDLVFDMENLQHFDGPTFEADVLQAVEPVVVDFYADWCPPCRMMEPAVEKLAGEFAGKVALDGRIRLRGIECGRGRVRNSSVGNEAGCASSALSQLEN